MNTLKDKEKVCSAKKDQSAGYSQTENIRYHPPGWYSSRHCYKSDFDREADVCHSGKNNAEKCVPDVADETVIQQQILEDDAELTSLFLSRSGSMGISSSVSLSTQVFSQVLPPPSSSSASFVPQRETSLLGEEYRILDSSYPSLFPSRTQ